ncbi:TIGR00725 family protein [Nocardioides sp. SOB77]|uniref:TIGR00725 family protein n=1 Tax=Nocardioides oceani TaxID=3058369 RepID=A0ABT8FFM0_9ACTN|nr:TIGR00725 family protein [Nocardioides oceani]MDN4173473.1 TIGR00725 family protein [Nocardioides oceani]
MGRGLAGRYVAVVGPADTATGDQLAAATEVGRLLAGAGAVVLTGGLHGVMRAAATGARDAGGTAIGLLPGDDRTAGSPEHAFLLPTGLGELRNGLLVRAADAVVAVGCSWGTLSGIALARRTGVPLVLLDPWDLPGDVGTVVVSPTAAVDTLARDLARDLEG